jgi:hypothetical protein
MNSIFHRYRELVAIGSMGTSLEQGMFIQYAQNIGRQVYDLLFSSLGELYSSTNEFVMAQDEAIFFPSELAFDGSNFLCMRANVGSLIGDLVPASSVEPQGGYGKNRTALLIGDDGDLLREIISSDRFASVQQVSDPSSIIKHFESCSLLHFAGRGYSADDPFSPKLLVRSHEPASRSIALDVEQLVNIANLKGALVFLNVCPTGKVASSLPQLGLARGFIRAGASSCVVASLPLGDQTAEMFATEFYRCCSSRENR